MARTRALDYAEKEHAILNTAARLFSRLGVERTSMATIASECGYSKALLYHYYDSKESILTDIVTRHLDYLITEVSAAQSTETNPEASLRAMVKALLKAYGEFEDQHRIQLAGLSSLSADNLENIHSLERQLVGLFAEIISRLIPNEEQSQRMLKPITMSLFGMLNWHYKWFRQEGPMNREQYADLATGLILYGATEPNGKLTDHPMHLNSSARHTE